MPVSVCLINCCRRYRLLPALPCGATDQEEEGRSDLPPPPPPHTHNHRPTACIRNRTTRRRRATWCGSSSTRCATATTTASCTGTSRYVRAFLLFCVRAALHLMMHVHMHMPVDFFYVCPLWLIGYVMWVGGWVGARCLVSAAHDARDTRDVHAGFLCVCVCVCVCVCMCVCVCPLWLGLGGRGLGFVSLSIESIDRVACC